MTTRALSDPSKVVNRNQSFNLLHVFILMWDFSSLFFFF